MKKKTRVARGSATRIPKGFESFTPSELRLLRSLSTPARVQSYLEAIHYNSESVIETCRSPRAVLRSRKAQCMEGALFAAAALRFHGHKPLVVDLEADGDYDHVLCVFQERGLWGAISKSRFHSLGFRDPVYRSIRELALSYVPMYNNYRGEKTLRRYSRPINLARFDKDNWIAHEGEVWMIPEYLCVVKHYPLFPSATARSLRRVPLAAQYADTAQPPTKWLNRKPKKGH